MNPNRHPHQRGTPSNIGAQQARFLDGVGTPSLRHKNLDGSESTKVNGRIYVRPSPQDDLGIELSRLSWIPEGIVITPRTEANQLGWGLPPTEDGKGTVGGDFPFVVLNHYENNNTPEYLHKVYSNRRVLPSMDGQANLNWPLLTMPYGEEYSSSAAGKWRDVGWSSIGSTRGGSFLPQFVAPFVPLLNEKRQTQWYCHRPKLREVSAAAKLLLAAANAARASAATPRPPFSPPIEGWNTDFAMTAMIPMVLTKSFLESGAALPQKWRLSNDRIRLRGGRLASYGELESLAAPDMPASEMANYAVNGWLSFPGTSAYLLADYTNGARDVFTAQGSAQYLAEVLSCAFWPILKAESDKWVGQEKTKPIFVSLAGTEAPPLSRVSSWTNPIFGSISVNAPASLLSARYTRLFNWANVSVVYYKNTAIQVTTTANIETSRAYALGAAFKVSTGESRLTVDEWQALLEKKRRRENPIGSTAGSEDGLTYDMASWDVEMYCLSYVETGAKYACPSTSGGSWGFELHKGDPHDFLNTKTLVASVSLGFNPTNVSNVALFSDDGSKCVVMAAEILNDASGKWDGEKLHFYELSDSGAVEIATSEITIDAGGTTFAADAWQSAEGECNLLPYYDGNTLQWVTCKYNCDAYVHPSAARDTGRTLYKALKIGTTEWPYLDTAAGGVAGGKITVTGTERHLLSFDPRRLDDASWVEFTMSPSSRKDDLGGGEFQYYAAVDAAVRKNIPSPQTTKALYSGVEIKVYSDYVGGSLYFLCLESMYTDKSPFAPFGTEQRINPHWRHSGGQPTSAFKASFFLGMTSLSNPTRQYGYGSAYQPKTTPFAPVSFFETPWDYDGFAEAVLNDTTVQGGHLHSQPFGIGGGGVTGGTHYYFRHSDIDLEGITGVAGLSDNILPIWSM